MNRPFEKSAAVLALFAALAVSAQGIDQGVEADTEVGAMWVRRAAEQGHTSAQYNLGLMYYNGDGVAQDNVMAHVWTTFAAANG